MAQSGSAEVPPAASKPRARPRAESRAGRGLLALLHRIGQLWRPHAGVGLLIVLCLLIQQGFSAAFALSLKLIIDQALPGAAGEMLWRVLGGLLGLFVLAALCTVAADYLTARVSARLLNHLRWTLFRHLQGLSLSYYQRAQTGDLGARFSNDLSELEKGLIERPLDGVCALLGLCTGVALLVRLSPLLGALVLCSLPLVTVLSRPLYRYAASAAYGRKHAEGQLASTVAEGVRVRPVIQAFGLRELVQDRFRAQLDEVARFTFRESFFSSLVGTGASQGVLLVQLLGVITGAVLAYQGRLTAGGLAALVSLLGTVTKDAYSLTKKVVPSLVRAAGGLQRIDEILAQRPEVSDRQGAQPLPRLSREIRFAGVCFTYPGSGPGSGAAPARPHLADLSFMVRAGERVALVGPSGGGKSTILSLLLRFYDPDAGAVLIDGHDLRQVTQESLRAQLGLVFQEPLLLDSSVRDNIRMGQPAATDAAVEAAARAAEIHEQILALPQGYETQIGELGGRLSGGQRQRIAVARAILRDPAVLVLDEALSALDPGTAAQLAATLERLSADRTVITVTHRLWQARDADRILVIEGGRLVEEGRHEELLQRAGRYAQLWHKEGQEDPG